MIQALAAACSESCLHSKSSRAWITSRDMTMEVSMHIATRSGTGWVISLSSCLFDVLQIYHTQQVWNCHNYMINNNFSQNMVTMNSSNSVSNTHVGMILKWKYNKNSQESFSSKVDQIFEIVRDLFLHYSRDILSCFWEDSPIHAECIAQLVIWSFLSSDCWAG